MRIEGQTKFTSEVLRKGATEEKIYQSFAGVMKHSKTKLQSSSLNQLIDRIDLQGQRLAKQQTIENLVDYKKLIKQFVTESLIYGLQLSEKQSLYSNSGMKSHQLVEIIDEKLLTINNEVLDSEKKEIDILSIVGEIKGLLINLYM